MQVHHDVMYPFSRETMTPQSSLPVDGKTHRHKVISNINDPFVSLNVCNITVKNAANSVSIFVITQSLNF